MSYTAEIKRQLTETEDKSRACKRAEFYAMYMMTDGVLRTGSADIARRAIRLCTRAGGVPDRIACRHRRTGAYTYLVYTRWSGHFTLETVEEAAAFLRGCFLLGGYVTEPSKPSHLEIQFREEVCYELGMAAFELAGITVKGTLRDGKFILYLKNSEEISSFLARTGAVKGVLEYENARILKQCKKESNRVMNCDDANINKTVETGLRQKSHMEALIRSARFDELPEHLRETARLRAENPELSLTELGRMLHPPLGKAGVAKRLRKLETLADGTTDGKN